MIGPFFTPKTQNSACLSVQPVARPSRQIYTKRYKLAHLRGVLPVYDASPGLPDNVTHEPGNVDRIFTGALAEIFDEPFLGLVMDEDIEMADACFFEALVKRRDDFWAHISLIQ